MAAEVQPGEENLEAQKIEEVRKVRKAVSDTYVFVRSRETNRTIGSFTFDHYIEEAKRQIKGDGAAIRNATGESIDLRPTKLESLDSVEDEFRATLETARTMAKAADASLQKDIALLKVGTQLPKKTGQ